MARSQNDIVTGHLIPDIIRVQSRLYLQIHPTKITSHLPSHVSSTSCQCGSSSCCQTSPLVCAYLANNISILSMIFPPQSSSLLLAAYPMMQQQSNGPKQKQLTCWLYLPHYQSSYDHFPINCYCCFFWRVLWCFCNRSISCHVLDTLTLDLYLQSINFEHCDSLKWISLPATDLVHRLSKLERWPFRSTTTDHIYIQRSGRSCSSLLEDETGSWAFHPAAYFGSGNNCQCCWSARWWSSSPSLSI
jgi:hypothetical protein